MIGLAGLFLLAASYLNPIPGYAQSQDEQDSTLEKTNISKTFLKLESQIRNSEIDFNQIEEEIESTKSDFEKNYLSSLIKIRKGDYETAFTLLNNLLDEKTSYLPYYDELVTSAKITGNITQLRSWIERQNATSINSLYLSSIINFENGNYNESITELKQILEKDSSHVVVFYKLAYSYRLVGNYNQSLEMLKKAEVMLSPGNKYYAKVLNGKGSIYFLSGEYESAEKNYTEAYNSAKNSGNTVERIKAVGNLAIIKDSYGDVYSAREDLAEAIKQAKEINNQDLLSFLYSEIGVSFTYTNEIIKARKNYEQSYKFYSTLKNRERLSYLSANIGSIYLQEANYKSALKYYREGLKHSAENKLGMILNLTGIADVYSNSSNYSRALEYYQRANQLADSIQSVASLIKIEQGIGALFYNINKPLGALNFLIQAKERINDEEYPFETTELYYKIGTVLASVDSIDSSIKYFQDGLNIAIQTGDLYNEIILNTELAHNYYLQNNFRDALINLTNASTMAKKYELTQLIGLQELYYGKIRNAQNNLSAAYKHFKNSFSISERASDKNTQIEAGYLLAQLSVAKDDLHEAENWFNKTVSIIENISLPLFQTQQIQIAHFTGFDEIFNSFINFYLNENKTKQAFELLEKSRSRNTMQNLVNNKLTSSIEDEELVNKFSDLKWMYNSDLYSNEEKAMFKSELNELKNMLSEKDGKLAQQLSMAPWKSVDEIKNKLDEGDNLISVFTAEDKTVIFHLTKHGLKTVKIDLTKDELRILLESITPIYKSDLASDEIYVNQDLFSYNAKAAYNFYKAIFKNVIDNIPADETIIFSFTNELLRLPAEMLVTEWQDGDSPFYYKDKNFLIERNPILYTPSASIYVVQNEKKLSKNNSNLLVGDPAINNDEFSVSYRGGLLSDDDYSSRNIELFPLEFSDEEIENVDEIISNNIVLTSEDANEDNFKIYASSSNLIHLSTHSFLYKNQPLIILSQTNEEENDGFLEVSEIVQMNLNSDLVVLSSCRSGLGRIDEAEGIIGMQKAFFEAGAKSVVVSLWDVNDKYTSFFMKDFYHHLSEGLNKSDALRSAKLNFIKKYSANPYYWSAFILSGSHSKMKLEVASIIKPPYILITLIILLSLIFTLRKIKRK